MKNAQIKYADSTLHKVPQTYRYSLQNFTQNNIFTKIEKLPYIPIRIPKQTRRLLRGADPKLDTQQ